MRIKCVIEAETVHERNFWLMEMKPQSRLKKIWAKWFPEIKGGIIPRDNKGRFVSRLRKYPTCHGAYLPSDIPIKNIQIRRIN